MGRDTGSPCPVALPVVVGGTGGLLAGGARSQPFKPQEGARQQRQSFDPCVDVVKLGARHCLKSLGADVYPRAPNVVASQVY